MTDLGEKTCPLCAEEMDLTDQQLKPCKCGYQICVWCWHHIVDMAEKDQIEGRCPACRTPYDKEKIVGMTVNCDSLASGVNIERKKIQKSRSKPSEGRNQLTNVRVIQRNLVYIVGLPLNLADEDLLQRKEYFGQYGKVLKVSMSRTASGVIQQFPNNTCSVYITYEKEEEAASCIQVVHGFILDGKSLKACFGTTKYCHAWLRNVACINPDCLYLHEVGSQEDSFTKDEIVPAYTRIQQITGATNILQHRSGNMLPPPLDAYCSDSSSAKQIVNAPSTNAASVPRYSPPSVSGSSNRSTALPAAARWGTHNANKQSLPSSVTSNGSSDVQKSTSVNGTLAFSAVVANTTHGPESSSDVQKRPLRKEGSQIVVDKSKTSMLNPLQHNVVVNSGSKRTTSPDRDPTSNRLASSVESSYGDRYIDKISATVNSIDDANEAIEDGPTVSNLLDAVARMGIDKNCVDERLDSTMSTGSQCDQSSITPPSHEVLKLSQLEQCSIDSSINTDKKAIPSDDGVSRTRPEWDWRSDLQSQVQGSSKLDMEAMSSFDAHEHLPKEDIIHSRFLSNSSSSILDTSHMASSSSSLPCEISGQKNSNLWSSLGRNGDGMLLSNGFSEKSMSSVEHSLFANEGGNKICNGEDAIVSNILSLDFDPWDESLTSPHHLADYFGEVDQRSTTLSPSNLLKQNNRQSRFSFARYEESSNQTYDGENHSNYGQIARDQPIQKTVVTRDNYQDNLGSLNGFAANYSGRLDNCAASPLFSSHKNPVSRPPPPGFSAPSRLPPPGFSSHERVALGSDTAPGTRYLDSTSLLRNAYHIPPPIVNSSSASDIEFVDPAILAVGRGSVNADLDMRSGFSSQLNSFENITGLQMLRQQSISAAQQEVNGFRHDLRHLSPSLTDPYGFNSRLMDQTQGSILSPLSQLPRQQQSANPVLSNGHWDKWNEGQSVNSLGMAELLKNERLGINGSLFNNGYEEPKFRIPSPGDMYNRTYGM